MPAEQLKRSLQPCARLFPLAQAPSQHPGLEEHAGPQVSVHVAGRLQDLLDPRVAFCQMPVVVEEPSQSGTEARRCFGRVSQRPIHGGAHVLNVLPQTMKPALLVGGTHVGLRLIG